MNKTSNFLILEDPKLFRKKFFHEKFVTLVGDLESVGEVKTGFLTNFSYVMRWE
jgi:hypothetical protein